MKCLKGKLKNKRFFCLVTVIVATSLLFNSMVFATNVGKATEQNIETAEPVIEVDLEKEPNYVNTEYFDVKENLERESNNSVIQKDAVSEKTEPADVYNRPVPVEPNMKKAEIDTYETSNISKEKSKFVKGQFLVKFKNSFSKEDVGKQFMEKGVSKYSARYEKLAKISNSSEKLKRAYNLVKNTYLVTIPDKSNEGVLKWVKKFKENPNVEYAEPNYICDIASVPNDYNENSLWNMKRVSAPSAWNVTVGSKSIKVGILDTGIDSNHPDLKDNVDASLGWNCVLNANTDTLDYNGHGTHVAGIIGAKGNNSTGVVGLNWNITMVPIKICYSNQNTSSDASLMADGIEHATINDIKICNLSYGVPEYSVDLHNAIQAYSMIDGTLVVAAGNDGQCIDNVNIYQELSANDNVILVSNSDSLSGEEECLYSGSNYGDIVDVSAPGTGIWSTIPGGYGSMTGTSMAAPMVTGVVALLKDVYPSLTPSQIKTVIIKSSDYVPKIAGEVASNGRLNANKALNMYYYQHLICEPNNNETLKDAVIRSLGSNNGANVVALTVVGNANMAEGTSSQASVSTVLPNLEYLDVSNLTTNLKKYSFYGCSKLTTVTLANNGTSLPAYCFMYCTKLDTIYRAGTRNKVLDEADLSGLTGVTSTSNPFAIQTQCFFGDTSLVTVKLSNECRYRIAQYAFCSCTSLKTVYISTFPKTYGCADLTEFSEIGSSVFNHTGIESVKLPKDVNISSGAFQNCTQLVKIQIYPSQTTNITIGTNAFSGVNASCKAYMNQALYSISNFVIPRTDTVNIPKYTNSLIIIPMNGETISDNINAYLHVFAAANIENLVIMGSASLGNSTSSTSASILPNLKLVDFSDFSGQFGAYTFYGCSKLQYVIRNKNFTSVPAQFFMFCGDLNTIIVNGEYPKVYGEVDLSDLSGALAANTQSFESCYDITTIKFPSGNIGFPGSFYNCSSLFTIYREGRAKVSGTFDLTGVSNFWPGWGNNLVGTPVQEVKLPLNVEISNRCLYNNTNLKSIKFDQSQTLAVTIGNEAFYNANASCKAYMNATLVNNNAFQLPRNSTENIPKYVHAD